MEEYMRSSSRRVFHISSGWGFGAALTQLSSNNTAAAISANHQIPDHLIVLVDTLACDKPVTIELLC